MARDRSIREEIATLLPLGQRPWGSSSARGAGRAGYKTETVSKAHPCALFSTEPPNCGDCGRAELRYQPPMPSCVPWSLPSQESPSVSSLIQFIFLQGMKGYQSVPWDTQLSRREMENSSCPQGRENLAPRERGMKDLGPEGGDAQKL